MPVTIDEVRLDTGADHAGDKAEVRGQAVVESIDDAAQVAAARR